MASRRRILTSVSRHFLKRRIEKRRKLKELDANIHTMLPQYVMSLNDLSSHDAAGHEAAARGLLNILDTKPEIAARLIDAITPEAMGGKDFSPALKTKLRKLAEPTYEAKMLPYHLVRLNMDMSGVDAAALTEFLEKRLRMDHKQLLATHLILKIDARVLGHHGGDLVSRLNSYVAAMSPDAYARKVMGFYVRHFHGLGAKYVEPVLKSLLLMSPPVAGEMRRMMGLHRVTPSRDMADKIAEATRGMEKTWIEPEMIARAPRHLQKALGI